MRRKSTMLGCVFAMLCLPALANEVGVYAFCDTSAGYQRMARFSYARGAAFERHLFAELRKNKDNRAAAVNSFKYPKPSGFNCRTTTDTTLYLEKNNPINGTMCMRPESWSECKWIGRRHVQRWWRPTQDYNIWRKRPNARFIWVGRKNPWD